MNRHFVALSLALALSAPAQAIQVSLVIGHIAVSSVVSARLDENGRDVPVTVAQAWLDPNELRLDLTDRNAVRHELRLRTKAMGRSYEGSLWRHGKRHWVRCREA